MSKIATVVIVTFALTPVTMIARAQVSVQGDPVHVQRVRAGESYAGTIVVRNGSAESQEAKVYQTDYVRAADGVTDYAEPGTTPRSNAHWISVGARVVVPPHQSTEIPYTVAVPAQPPLAGTYWSMVMVETVPRGSAESGLVPPPPAQQSLSLITKFRYAVQIVSNVGSDARRDAKFESPGVLTARDSSRALQVDLRNSGELAFVPALTLELYAEDGTHVKTVRAVRELIYPGMAVRQLFALGQLPRGKYRGIVTADTGDDAVFGAQYTFAF